MATSIQAYCQVNRKSDVKIKRLIRRYEDLQKRGKAPEIGSDKQLRYEAAKKIEEERTEKRKR